MFFLQRLAGLNGGAARFDLFWKTVVFAPLHVIVAWVVFGACGVAAYVLRYGIGSRLLMVAVVLVGLPVVWGVSLFG